MHMIGAIATLTVYEKPTCTTCRKLRALLAEHNVEYESSDYHATGIREDELRGLLGKLGYRASARAALATGDTATSMKRVHAPNQRARRLEPNRSFCAICSAEGALKVPVLVGPDRKSMSTLPMRPSPHSM